MILEHFGLDSDCKKLTYNGDKDTKEEDWEWEPVPKEEATSFRALAARFNFLSQDCPDLQFPIKQCSRDMANPLRGSWKKMKKIARYLLAREKIVWDFKWQEEPEFS